MLDDFLSEAREYADRRGITLTTLGLYAVADSRLFHRLENGGQCMPRTMDKVRVYIRMHPIPSSNQENSHDLSQPDASSDAA